MKEETSGIYGKPRFGLIVVLFAVTILVVMVAALLYLRSGHPVFHTEPQPKDNKGTLTLPVSTVQA